MLQIVADAIYTLYMHKVECCLTSCRGTNVTYVREDVKLDVVFKEFMSSANHMLLVQGALNGDPETNSAASVCGLITLEDVMEELIGVSPELHGTCQASCVGLGQYAGC